MYHIFSIHSSVEGHLGCCQFLPIINMAAMNIVEHVSLLHVEASSGYMPRSDIAGSLGSSMANFLRNHQTDFQSGYTSLQSHQQWRSFPFSPHPRQHLLSPAFLILVIMICKAGISGFFWFAFPSSLRTLNISLSASQLFSIPQLRILRLARYFFF